MTLKEILFSKEKNKNEKKPKVYVIVDTATIENVTFELLKTKLKYENLYNEEDAEELEEVAPYLVELLQEDDFTKWIIEEVYGNLSCMFLESYEDIDSLAEHLRKFVNTTMWVKHPKKVNELMSTKAYVRFYDPRVITSFLHLLEDRVKFFSKFDSIYIEDKFSAKELWTFTVDNEQREAIV